MRTRKQVTEDIEEIKQAMKNTASKAEFQRLQCVYLADTQQDMAAEKIGEIVMLSTHRVKMIHTLMLPYAHSTEQWSDLSFLSLQLMP